VLFGPVVLVYFATLATLGVVNIAAASRDPRHPQSLLGVRVLRYDPRLAFLAMGSVFLAVTGAETLYADMGHFGRKAIGVSWLTLVYPCLMLNYMGQGALLLEHPAAVENPFYLMAPEWARLPLVLIATAATIIASQAVISGAFSVTHQAIQLGFLPRLRTLHTSEKAAGQIYIPAINWGLLAMVLVLVLGFGESTRLASAYGISVVGTMLITTVMLGFLVFQVWRWNRWLASRHDRPVPAGRRRLFRLERDQDSRRRLVPAARRRRAVHGPDHLGDRPQADARAARGDGDAAAGVHQVGAASAHRVRNTAVFLSASPDASLRRCCTTSSTTRCCTSGC
jgi:KUP system potassium uptake protein